MGQYENNLYTESMMVVRDVTAAQWEAQKQNAPKHSGITYRVDGTAEYRWNGSAWEGMVKASANSTGVIVIRAPKVTSGGFGATVLKTSALHKPYGTSDMSFNKGSGLSSAAITTCVKSVVNAPFTAARIVSTNRGTATPTGVKALLSVTETMATNNSNNLAQTVIGGTAYAALAGATDQNGQRAVTWGGAASVTHSASSAAGPDLKLSDWQPIKAVARADGGTGYVYFRKMYRDGAAGNWAFTTLTNTPADSTANRNRPVVVSNYFGDGIASISNTYSLTATSDDAAVEFKFDRPVLSVWGAGDSIMSCVGLVADKTASWLHRACEDVSTSATPVVCCNFGAAGTTAADFLTNITAYLAAGVTPPSVLFVSVSVNEIGSTPDVRKAETCIKTISDASALCEKYGIPFLFVVPICPNENIASSILDTIRKQINTYAATVCSQIGAGILNLSALGDGAAKELYVPAYKFDAVHPNETAIEAIIAPAAKAMLQAVI